MNRIRIIALIIIGFLVVLGAVLVLIGSFESDVGVPTKQPTQGTTGS